MMKMISAKRILAFLFVILSSALLLYSEYALKQIKPDSYGTDYSVISVYSNEIPDLDIKIIRSSNDEDEETYLFLPFKNANWRWSVPDDIDLFVDGVRYRSGDELQFSNSDADHLLAIAKEEQFTDVRYLRCCCADKVSVVSISIDENELEMIRDEGYPLIKANSHMMVLDESAKEQCNTSCFFGGHGNSTWASGKKPYEIKTELPMSFLGLDYCQGWNLLANRMDCSNLKNRIVYEACLGTQMEYNVKCEYVNVYINGVYQGLYLITEKPSTGDGIVTFSDDIEKENIILSGVTEPTELTPIMKNENTKEEIRYYDMPSPPDISGSYFMEFDSYEENLADHSYESWFRTDKSKDQYGSEWRVIMKQPKLASEDEILYIKKYVRETEAAIYSEDGIDTQSGIDYRERIDDYSWEMSYLFTDFFANHDTSGGSLFMYKKRRNPVLYSGPIWDYDKSMTDNFYDEDPFPWYGKAETIVWYSKLREYDDFHNGVVECYRHELSPVMETVINEKIPMWLDEIRSSTEMDEIRWNRGKGYETKRAKEVTDWIKKRKELFDLVWVRGENSPYSKNIY